MLALVGIAPMLIVRRYKGPGRLALSYAPILAFLAIAYAIEGAGRSTMPFAYIAAIAATLPALIVLLEKRSERALAAANEDAARSGITSEQVERSMPQFTSRKNYALKPGRCTAFSIRRSDTRAPEEWAFLERTAKDGAEYPNNFLFRTAGGVAPPEMQALLREIANAIEEGYVEFEATKSKVTVFCEPGEVATDVLFDWLRRLAAF